MAGASLGVLAALAERSMIQRLPDAQGGSRYQVHELVRHYALRHVEDDRAIRAGTSRTSSSSWRASKRPGTPKSNRWGLIPSAMTCPTSAPH